LFYDLHKFGDEYGLKIKVNFFAEKHGKSYCDGRFGVIKRFIRDYTNKKEKKNQNNTGYCSCYSTYGSYFKIKGAE
jgi:hypothetical protein